MQHAGVIYQFLALESPFGLIQVLDARSGLTYSIAQSSNTGPHHNSRSLALTSQARRTLQQSAMTLYSGTDMKPWLCMEQGS